MCRVGMSALGLSCRHPVQIRISQNKKGGASKGGKQPYRAHCSQASKIYGRLLRLISGGDLLLWWPSFSLPFNYTKTLIKLLRATLAGN